MNEALPLEDEEFVADKIPREDENGGGDTSNTGPLCRIESFGGADDIDKNIGDGGIEKESDDTDANKLCKFFFCGCFVR